LTLQRKLKNLLNKQLIFLFIFLFVGFVALPFLYKKSPVKVFISQDVSLPYHLWISLPYLQKPYVEFPVYWDDKYFQKNKDFLIKILACDEGHYLEVDKNKNYYCDGKFLGKALDTDKKGNPIKNFVWNGKIPKGKAFVIGIHPRSYDSRYFGFIDKEKIIRYLYPIK